MTIPMLWCYTRSYLRSFLDSTFSAVAILAGPAIYRAFGGSAEAHQAALLYSNYVFAASVPVWIVNLCSAALRGSGNVRVAGNHDVCRLLYARLSVACFDLWFRPHSATRHCWRRRFCRASTIRSPPSYWFGTCYVERRAFVCDGRGSNGACSGTYFVWARWPLSAPSS